MRVDYFTLVYLFVGVWWRVDFAGAATGDKSNLFIFLILLFIYSGLT